MDGTQFFGWNYPLHSPVSRNIWYPGVMLGVILIFLVGAADDIWDLRPRTKLLGQIVAAGIVAASGLLLVGYAQPRRARLHRFRHLRLSITIFYLVAFMNVINLIDGLDGLASGITAISALTMFIFATLTFRLDAAFLAVGLIGICLGFLRYNFNPASIFMGDSDRCFSACLSASCRFSPPRARRCSCRCSYPSSWRACRSSTPHRRSSAACAPTSPSSRPTTATSTTSLREGFSQRKTVLIMWG